jgi:hypothetical protein
MYNDDSGMANAEWQTSKTPMSGIAQLVEHATLNRGAEGSSPSSGGSFANLPVFCIMSRKLRRTWNGGSKRRKKFGEWMILHLQFGNVYGMSNCGNIELPLLKNNGGKY